MHPDHPLRLCAQTLAASNNANMAVCQLRMPGKKNTFQTNGVDMISKCVALMIMLKKKLNIIYSH